MDRLVILVGPGSSVGIATDYGLGAPGIELQWGEFFRRANRPWGPPSLLYNWYRVFYRGKVRRVMLLTLKLSSAVVMVE